MSEPLQVKGFAWLNLLHYVREKWGADTLTELARNFPGGTIAPAFFDVHIHGAAGHDVMEGTPEALRCVGRFLASRGTGARSIAAKACCTTGEAFPAN